METCLPDLARADQGDSLVYPPVGLIRCAQKNEAIARCALDRLPNKVMAAEYRTTQPDEDLPALEIDRIREALCAHGLLPEETAMAGSDTLRTKANRGNRERAR